ncbi:SET and MYND domain-containing protein 3, partial [Halocaridina rubra]
MENCVGTGLFQTASLVNHSCNPNAHYYTVGRRLILRALRPISPGEEVTMSYTRGFADLNLQERKFKLESFFVNCTCEACAYDWPKLHELPQYNFRCIRCGHHGKDFYICHICRKRQAAESSEKSAKEVVLKRWFVINKEVDSAMDRMRTIELKSKTEENVDVVDFQALSAISDLLHGHLMMPCQSLLILE